MSERTNKLPPFLLNAIQVAKRLGISKEFAYSIMRRGDIPVVRLGRAVRVRPKDLEEFIETKLDKGHNGKTAW